MSYIGRQNAKLNQSSCRTRDFVSVIMIAQASPNFTCSNFNRLLPPFITFKTTLIDTCFSAWNMPSQIPTPLKYFQFFCKRRLIERKREREREREDKSM